MNAADDPRLSSGALLDANAVLFALSDSFAKLRTPQGSRAASALAVAAACACDVAAYVGEDPRMSIADAVRAVAAQFANTAAHVTSPAASSPHEAPASPGVRDETIGTEELARRLRRRACTLRKLAASGVMPARKVGRGWLFNWSAICDWIARKETTQCPSDVTPSLGAAKSAPQPAGPSASELVRTRPAERRRAARSSATDADRRWIESIIRPERTAEAAERAT